MFVQERAMRVSSGEAAPEPTAKVANLLPCTLEAY